MTSNLFIPQSGLTDFIEVDNDAYNNFLTEWETKYKPEDIKSSINNVKHILSVNYYGSRNSTYVLHNKNKAREDLIERVDFDYIYDDLKPFQLEYLAYYDGKDTENVSSELIDIESKILEFKSMQELLNVRDSLLNNNSINLEKLSVFQ